MKEIGGYFGMERFSGNEYHPGLTALNSGRNALLYLLKARKIKKIYIPFFLCDSVSLMCDSYGYEYEYYHITKDFLPIFDKILQEGEYLYIVNFYGRIDNDKALELKKLYVNIILDNVQAFFQKPVSGIDTIYSCRKFFGVPDGSYLSTDVLLGEELEQDVSKDRMTHILGRYELNASDYYSNFKENDYLFKQLPLKKMSALTHNLLRAIDYEAVKNRRNKNYAALEKMLGKVNILDYHFVDGAYAYPFYHPNGMEIKRKLAENKIYVATLWPNVLNFTGCQQEKDYTENILPLPVDQRYDESDMEHIVRTLNANL